MSQNQAPPKVLVVAVGTGGCRIAAELYKTTAAAKLNIVLVDTDEQALQCYPDFQTLHISADWSDKHGCGGDALQGFAAASEKSPELKALITDNELLIVISPLGGGTASGAIPVIAQIARELQVFSMFIATRPFSFEGDQPLKNAKKSIQECVKLADAFICLDNDVIFSKLSGNFSKDFTCADKTLADCVAGLTEMLFCDGLIKLDFTHVKKILTKKEASCTIAMGKSTGENRVQTVIDELLNSSTLGGKETLKKCNAAVMTLCGGADLSTNEINECLVKLTELFSPNADIHIGVSCTDDARDSLQLTLLTIRHSKKISKEDLKPIDVPSSGRKNEEKSVYNIQDELPLMEMTSGIFENLRPSNHHGINLDIPTYIREGYIPDTGPE
ncbi:MAG: hypothetical protein HRT88_14225 [Lentisphaeraceae bacterium]|nr:hypothetical protein [Lentisphaeraceae bacterium]